MKIIKYRLMTEVNYGTEKCPNIERIFQDVTMGWNEVNEETAKAEAYNGEYTIEDDGVEEEMAQAPEQRIAELEEALELLLSGVTE